MQLITPDEADDAVDLIWRKAREALSEAISARSASLADLYLKIGLLRDCVDDADTETRQLLALLQVDLKEFQNALDNY